MPPIPTSPRVPSEKKAVAASLITNNSLTSPCVSSNSSINCSDQTVPVIETPNLRQIANVLLSGSIASCEERSLNRKYDHQLLQAQNRQSQNLDSSTHDEIALTSVANIEKPLRITDALISLGKSITLECARFWHSPLDRKPAISASVPISNSTNQNTSTTIVPLSKFPKLSRSSLIVSFPQENSSFVPQNTKLANPAPESKRIASPFGWRKRPYSNQQQFHQGIDYGAPYGSPVVAIGNGIVTKVVSGCADFGSLFCGGQLGNWIEIDHGDGVIGTYGHLKNSSIMVEAGMKVRKNQNIAQVGSSGWSTGAHLDFRLKVDGEHEDPAKHVMAIKRTDKD
ncbi:M23 family metallopeptidase [Pleurocapsales cyanobacterium LEGE 10410]|nr:M23 family metallopeptidase [Pleurocapsales cyanobacterium LEGE 10410]